MIVLMSIHVEQSLFVEELSIAITEFITVKLLKKGTYFKRIIQDYIYFSVWYRFRNLWHNYIITFYFESSNYILGYFDAFQNIDSRSPQGTDYLYLDTFVFAMIRADINNKYLRTYKLFVWLAAKIYKHQWAPVISGVCLRRNNSRCC